MGPSQPAPGARGALLLALGCGVLYAIDLPAAGFFDNEGRYAEAARQMVVRADYVTPYMNGAPFLNKPPLVAWLAAGLLPWLAIPEWVRIVSVVAAMVAVYATARLGAHLRGQSAGLLAGVLLATTVGFVLEARTLRPDGPLVASMTTALLCLWHAEHVSGRRGRWLVGFYVALGVGILAKGFLPLVLLGPPVAAVAFGRHGWTGVRRLRPGLGLAVVGALVLPWHLWAAWRNPGFAWDFVVNQHLLFAFDKKEPRDSEGVSLLVFLGAFAGRATPWIALAALAARGALAEMRRDVWTLATWLWLLTPVLVFSLTPSRLEHYTLPALPAVALLAAGPAAAFVREGGAACGAVLSMLALGALGAGGILLERGTDVLSPIPWLAQAPLLLPIPAVAGTILACGGAAVVLALAMGRRAGALAALVVTTIGFDAVVIRAIAAVAPLLSWKTAAAVIQERAGSAAEVVFEAPVEYQLVGGLDFYLGRDVTLLEPAAGFVPPTYLEGRVGGMFVDRGEFERRWRDARPVVLVSDPTRRRDDPVGLVAEPYVVLGRFGNRWVLGNQALAR